MTRLPPPPPPSVVVGGTSNNYNNNSNNNHQHQHQHHQHQHRRSTSAEDFALAFGDVELHLAIPTTNTNHHSSTTMESHHNTNNPDATTTTTTTTTTTADALMQEDSTDLDLADFRDWWEAGAGSGVINSNNTSHGGGASNRGSPLPASTTTAAAAAAATGTASPRLSTINYSNSSSTSNNNSRFRPSASSTTNNNTATAVIDASIGDLSASTCPTAEITTTSHQHQHQYNQYHQYPRNHIGDAGSHAAVSTTTTITTFSRRDSNRSLASSSKMSCSITGHTGTGTVGTHGGGGSSSCGFSTDGECDDITVASRSSVKRRRTNIQNGVASLNGNGTLGCFEPLERVRELVISSQQNANGNGNGNGAAIGVGGDAEDDNNADGVRPWKVDIPDHDVVLGDTHEPTWGTKIYREIRKPYAKKTLTNEQLKVVKIEFQRRLEKEFGHKLPCAPTFWCNKDNACKIKHFSIAGFLKNRPGCIYAKAKDQAIKDDIKNASPRSRTRHSTKLFCFKAASGTSNGSDNNSNSNSATSGSSSLDQVIQKAKMVSQEWVGDDVDKELYAKGFYEDLERMLPWRDDYVARQQVAEQKAKREPILRGTHLRAAMIHQVHVEHLELALIDMINQLGNLMVESHKVAQKKTLSNLSISKSASSVGGDDTISMASSSNHPVQQQQQQQQHASRKKPPRSTTSGRGRGGNGGGGGGGSGGYTSTGSSSTTKAATRHGDTAMQQQQQQQQQQHGSTHNSLMMPLATATTTTNPNEESTPQFSGFGMAQVMMMDEDHGTTAGSSPRNNHHRNDTITPLTARHDEDDHGGACLATVSSITCSAVSHNSAALPTLDGNNNGNNNGRAYSLPSSAGGAPSSSNYDDSPLQDMMDLSPISVRKAMLLSSQGLQNESVDERGGMPHSQVGGTGGGGILDLEGQDRFGGSNAASGGGGGAFVGIGGRKDLSSMFSQTLRMGPLDRSLFLESTGSKISDVVVMPPGLPRDIQQPANAPNDELSVLSTPDDLSVLFMEARESAIRRGIDQPAALPRPGHVADRTKALLQQMGSTQQQRNNSTTGSSNNNGNNKGP